MTILHLGVMDIPYAYDQEGERKTKKRDGKKKRRVELSITTGDVAEILEDEYHLMELFFEEHQGAIVTALEESMAGALESAAMGAPRNDPFGAGTQQIDEMFKKFITEGGAEKLGIAGTPTAAALKGVNHRKAHPYAKSNPRRPSFVDTGLYVDSFMSWID